MNNIADKKAQITKLQDEIKSSIFEEYKKAKTALREAEKTMKEYGIDIPSQVDGESLAQAIRSIVHSAKNGIKGGEIANHKSIKELYEAIASDVPKQQSVKLAKMVKDGVLKKEGKGRSTIYKIK